MQWQATQARVVSMSLGGGPSDGTDPVSQAVNDLTAEYGTLFVIAAGNKGPDTRTVSQPGAAPSEPATSRCASPPSIRRCWTPLSMRC